MHQWGISSRIDPIQKGETPPPFRGHSLEVEEEDSQETEVTQVAVFYIIHAPGSV